MAKSMLGEIILRKGPNIILGNSWWQSSLSPSIPALNNIVSHSNRTSHYRMFSKTSYSSQKISSDRIEMFIKPEVQSLLKQLTAKDYQRVFRNRKIGQKLREPKYTFMTEIQLQDALKEAEEKADNLLQMPPVLRPRKPIDEILSFDPAIQGAEKSTIIFTDITMNISNQDRLIVARDPDGTLRHATLEEREKMNMIYFPREGKEFVVPKMFSDPENLNAVLNRADVNENTYEFLLDRACLQFDPDDPLYISICETTYDTIDAKGHFDFLKSTRHYGPLVFYLVRTRKMDNLLLYSIKNQRISSDALPLVSLFHCLFPESKSNSVSKGLKKEEDKIRAYIELDAVKRSELELTLNAYEEMQKNREELEEDLEKLHGIKKTN